MTHWTDPDEISRGMQENVQKGFAKVVKIDEKGVHWKISDAGRKRAEEVIAESFGVSVEAFRKSPKEIRNRITELVVKKFASE